MGRRPQRAQQHSHYDVNATITPETGFKLSIVQLIALISGIFFLASGCIYIAYNVTDIRDKQATAIITTTAAIKDQDEKRAQLGKQFIESNEKIASAVGSLATQMAVQQERQKSTDEKLEKVLMQISTTLSPSGAQRR